MTVGLNLEVQSRAGEVQSADEWKDPTTTTGVLLVHKVLAVIH
jgi:hypothetical protein